ncbi:hypothetical protein TNCV_3523971 [Trichonephila clavipes]|uniref:Uncharacterized protein n=1 Tax=Trichonephila clavipes TaxID=2585209 RepID=A0A8X6S6D8_TRICX|nr:hypothetical protein TNCV_3523971 [Trichonephila clavipes]
MFSAPQYAVFPATFMLRSAPNCMLGVKATQSRQDGCSLFAWKLSFQTQQQSYEQDEEPFSYYVDVRLMPSCDPAQMSMLCGDLVRLSC